MQGEFVSEKRKLNVGDWVQVRTKDEILRTLDSRGCLEGMPFMPEMFAFCGRKFKVYKRAHKTCDTVFPIRGRSVQDAVHLETRCDGSAHGGCQAGCLLFWKTAWLIPLKRNGEAYERTDSVNNDSFRDSSACAESDVWNSTQVKTESLRPAYMCQATQLPYATGDLRWWDVRQYLEDFTSGNVSLWRVVCGLTYSFYYHLLRSGIGLGPLLRHVYNTFRSWWDGSKLPRTRGTIPKGQSTPIAFLDLQPGELVRVKSHDEILKTLNTESMNRGLLWDAEMVPYCGKTFRVLKRVTKIVDEKTGVMQEMKTPCIVLESVICQSRYSECRMFCPRSIYSYWREIWLERVGPKSVSAESHRDLENVCAGQSASSQLVEIGSPQ